MTRSTDTTEVQVGQIWQDWDTRYRERILRFVKVESINGEHAFVRDLSSKRVTRIRLARFKPTSTGYRLVDRKLWPIYGLQGAP